MKIHIYFLNLLLCCHIKIYWLIYLYQLGAVQVSHDQPMGRRRSNQMITVDQTEGRWESIGGRNWSCTIACMIKRGEMGIPNNHTWSQWGSTGGAHNWSWDTWTAPYIDQLHLCPKQQTVLSKILIIRQFKRLLDMNIIQNL